MMFPFNMTSGCCNGKSQIFNTFLKALYKIIIETIYIIFTARLLYFLYSGVQEKLGIMNNGKVWAVFDYDGQDSDELSFKIGDDINVLRKGDEKEKEWWWSEKNKKEGYIPRNLLGVRHSSFFLCVFFILFLVSVENCTILSYRILEICICTYLISTILIS